MNFKLNLFICLWQVIAIVGFATGISVETFAALGIEWTTNSMALRFFGNLVTILFLETPLLVILLFFWLSKCGKNTRKGESP